jgi:hypothetical protein
MILEIRETLPTRRSGFTNTLSTLKAVDPAQFGQARVMGRTTTEIYIKKIGFFIVCSKMSSKYSFRNPKFNKILGACSRPRPRLLSLEKPELSKYANKDSITRIMLKFSRGRLYESRIALSTADSDFF